MRYAPNCRFYEVLLDGEYQGVYLMVETITDYENCRLNLSVNVEHPQTASFLLRMDRPNGAEIRDGVVVNCWMPRKLLPFMQALEYNRSFLAVRRQS